MKDIIFYGGLVWSNRAGLCFLATRPLPQGRPFTAFSYKKEVHYGRD